MRGGRGGSDRGDDSDADVRTFSRDVALPLGQARELVRFRDLDYAVNARDLEALATIGAFRVVAADDLPGCRATCRADLETGLRTGAKEATEFGPEMTRN